jgi:WhiB family redox-sensing transcriptional regulator
MSTDWRSAAACRGEDPDLFFSDDEAGTRKALAVCGGCPSRMPCLQFALLLAAHGTWGGTTESERRALNPAPADPFLPCPQGLHGMDDIYVHPVTGHVWCRPCRNASDRRTRQRAGRAA